MKRLILMALILCATTSFISCSKDDDNETKSKEETKTGAYDWILDYMRIVNMKDVHSYPVSIDTLHIDTLYSRTKEEIKGIVDAYNKTEQYATAEGTKYISNVIVAHNYTEMRTIKKDWGYMYHYTNDEIKKNQSLYRSYQGSYKNITEVAALDSARAIVKKYGHDLLWLSVWDEVANVVIYECGSSTASK